MTPTDQDVSLIAHVIQLAVAPVFLLTGLGALLSVMTNRLARVIDRARLVEGTWSALDEAARTGARRELETLARRAHLASWAVNFSTSAALLVCGVVATLFVDVFLGTNLRWLVSVLFAGSMLAIIGGLVAFLREVYLATHTLRIGPPQSPERAVPSEPPAGGVFPRISARRTFPR
jgi:hypothetical protein